MAKQGWPLDALAAELDLVQKGTLYKHFQSKDESYMLPIIRNEQMLLEMIKDTDKQFPNILFLCYIICIILNARCCFTK